MDINLEKRVNIQTTVINVPDLPVSRLFQNPVSVLLLFLQHVGHTSSTVSLAQDL